MTDCKHPNEHIKRWELKSAFKVYGFDYAFKAVGCDLCKKILNSKLFDMSKAGVCACNGSCHDIKDISTCGYKRRS